MRPQKGLLSILVLQLLKNSKDLLHVRCTNRNQCRDQPNKCIVEKLFSISSIPMLFSMVWTSFAASLEDLTGFSLNHLSRNLHTSCDHSTANELASPVTLTLVGIFTLSMSSVVNYARKTHIHLCLKMPLNYVANMFHSTLFHVNFFWSSTFVPLLTVDMLP